MASRIIHCILEQDELFSGLVLIRPPSTDYIENLAGIRQLITQTAEVTQSTITVKSRRTSLITVLI